MVGWQHIWKDNKRSKKKIIDISVKKAQSNVFDFDKNPSYKENEFIIGVCDICKERKEIAPSNKYRDKFTCIDCEDGNFEDEEVEII